MGRSEADLLKGLNPEQQRAVQTTEGPLLVLAGAGTGKTRVITRRIAHLCARSVPPRAILAVTFTNKAAREMKERVAELVGPVAAKELTVSTFHSFCVRLLREHADRLGLSKNFGICDDSDQQTAVKAALRECRIAETAVHPRAALSRISLYKNRLISPDQAIQASEDDWEESVARAYKAYDGYLRRSRTVDFDDLLLFTVKLLTDHADVRARLQARYLYLLVDEYQDTNGPQYEILRLLAGDRRNLCVVGDDDQSIYGWRGADVRKILNFGKDFPGTATIRLETNYRSTEDILAAANTVIRHNKNRHDKSLRTDAGKGDPVRVFACEDEEHEGQFVVDEIIRDTRAGRIKAGEIAILFRTAVQPRTFEGKLRMARIPYDLVGGMSFFDRKEVRDLLSYLRLAGNPDDEAALLRVVNVPPRGIGKSTLDKVVEFATQEGISAGAAFERAPGLSPDALEAFKDFRAGLADVARRAEQPGGLVQAAREMVLKVNYAAELERCYPDAFTRQARTSAVEEILNLAENYQRKSSEPSLTGFLEEVALNAADAQDDAKDKSPQDRVTLMTLHAAKGLEFPRVYLVGVEEGLIPHQRSIVDDTVEEERRLMYVGITRARRQLTITRVKTRAKYGRREPCLPSRFLFELKGEPVPFSTAKPPEKDAAPFLPPSKRGTNAPREKGNPARR